MKDKCGGMALSAKMRQNGRERGDNDAERARLGCGSGGRRYYFYCAIFILLNAYNVSEGANVPSEPGKRWSESRREDCPERCSCGNVTGDGGSGGFLVDVTCIDGKVTSVPEDLPPNMRTLQLQNSDLMGTTEKFDFGKFRHLNELNLARSKITRLSQNFVFPGLKILDLSYNQIERVPKLVGKNGKSLEVLLLGSNRIDTIEDDAFEGLDKLYILELQGNKLRSVPSGVIKLTSLREINLGNNRITEIQVPFHQLLPRIVDIELKGNPIQSYVPEAFAKLRHLKKLVFSDVKNLTEFPDLNGTSLLEILRIDRCSLHSLPPSLCDVIPKLKSLDLKSNKIRFLPKFQGCVDLKILDVSLNEIEDLEDGNLADLRQLHDLHLRGNRITRISAGALQGLQGLRALDLSHNLIEEIDKDAFLGLGELQDLNLGNNYFESLPSEGLKDIVHLKVANNPKLVEFPGPEAFPHVRTLVLSYAYHCCQFTEYGMAKSSSFEPGIQDNVLYPEEFGNGNLVPDILPDWGNFSQSAVEDWWKSFGGGPINLGYDGSGSSQEVVSTGVSNIQCAPLPGPFLPCTDLFDWWTLRCSVWVVFLLALMGNGTVVFVHLFSRTKMDVPRFLVCNLAIADLFMGIYLGFLAVVDAATLGEFRKMAISWQFSRGCQMAGFLGVLSSELSVYTLAVITMERHYAITHAMHLNKRLSLRHAGYIMLAGWTFALVMAILPLFGISDYRKFAVCLPFETSDSLSLSYVVFLMAANGVAFTILMGCYLKMYCSIRGSQAWNSNDTRIAKRMALLVFTDLICWFPIAFFSLTAVFGLRLISVEGAKVFTVFILPLNSCCNPFLYAILTKQFKKDCVMICKAIEESRVTRGIGRCRHSSNFSNRQTAPNTGSLVEKSSKDGQPCICHSGLHPGSGDENGNAKYRLIPPSERWERYGAAGRFFSKYILCHDDEETLRKSRDDYRMRNVRRFLYTSTPGNYPPEAEKHHRHPSVSSDNFSSSRSDSWRGQARCGIPLRLLEPRRRNSWAVTRKPSQDSNMSSSRNDSSATASSNTTATWRLSRSSVSSDAASHSGGGRSSLKKTLIAAAAASHGHNSYANVGRAMLTPANVYIGPVVAGAAFHGHPFYSKSIMARCGDGNNVVTAGLVGQGSNTSAPQPGSEAYLIDLNPKSSASNTRYGGGYTQPRMEKIEEPEPAPSDVDEGSSEVAQRKQDGDMTEEEQAESDMNITDEERSAKIATNRPRLVRQSAFFSDEVVIEPEVCPMHGSLLPGTYDDDEEDEISDGEPEGVEAQANDDPNPTSESPMLKKPLDVKVLSRLPEGYALASSPNNLAGPSRLPMNRRSHGDASKGIQVMQLVAAESHHLNRDQIGNSAVENCSGIDTSDGITTLVQGGFSDVSSETRRLPEVDRVPENARRVSFQLPEGELDNAELLVSAEDSCSANLTGHEELA